MKNVIGANDNEIKQLKLLIENENEPKYQRLRDFYQSCLEESNKFPELDADNLKKLLRNIGIKPDDWKTDTDDEEWFKYIYKLRDEGGNEGIHFILVYVDEDVHDNSKRIIKIDQPKLSAWTDDDHLNKKITMMLTLLDVSPTLHADIVKKTADFYKEIDAIRKPQRWYNLQSPKDLNTKIKIKKLIEDNSNIPWLEYIPKMLAENHGFDIDEETEVIVRNPDYIKKLKSALNLINIH